MKEPRPYDLNIVRIKNNAKIISEQEKKIHSKQKTMGNRLDNMTSDERDRRFDVKVKEESLKDRIVRLNKEIMMLEKELKEAYSELNNSPIDNQI